MSEFTIKYFELRKEAIEYITDFLKKNEGRFEYATEEEVESEDFTNISFDLAQATYIGRMEDVYYYAITSVTLEKNKLWFNGVSIEDSNDYNFGETEVDVACLCDCADLLIIKEK